LRGPPRLPGVCRKEYSDGTSDETAADW
jgi:hypothetical protein